jgi:DNA-binding MarR family transcriptional regulator
MAAQPSTDGRAASEPARTDPDLALTPACEGAWRAFLEAHARTTEVLSRELRAEDGLPLAWYDVLVHLSEAPERRLRMQELADAILLSKSGLTRLIDRMEREGLVSRTACSDDRRGTYAELTERGFARLEQAYPVHVAGVASHFAHLLDDDEAATLERLLRRIAEANAPTP